MQKAKITNSFHMLQSSFSKPSTADSLNHTLLSALNTSKVVSNLTGREFFPDEGLPRRNLPEAPANLRQNRSQISNKRGSVFVNDRRADSSAFEKILNQSTLNLEMYQSCASSPKARRKSVVKSQQTSPLKLMRSNARDLSGIDVPESIFRVIEEQLNNLDESDFSQVTSCNRSRRI